MTTAARRARPAAPTPAQRVLFGDDYAAALATLKRSGIPLPVVGMHWRWGILAGHTCGACESRRELWITGRPHYCSRASSNGDVPPETPACRKFRPEEERE